MSLYFSTQHIFTYVPEKQHSPCLRHITVPKVGVCLGLRAAPSALARENGQRARSPYIKSVLCCTQMSKSAASDRCYPNRTPGALITAITIPCSRAPSRSTGGASPREDDRHIPKPDPVLPDRCYANHRRLCPISPPPKDCEHLNARVLTAR